ncbi:MAG: hypothetical protein E7164_03325 [Firmicutes bacterium]|nr:hypothetical protein [Bacillota bacterium]
MKDLINKIIFIISVLIILFGMLMLIFKNSTTFSENENRYLAQFPRISLKNIHNGKFASGIEDYLNDQFPWRDSLVGFKTNIEYLLGKSKINGIYITDDKFLIPTFEKKNSSEALLKVLNQFTNSLTIPVSIMLVPNAIEIYNEKLPINNEKYNGIAEIEKIYKQFNGNIINVHDVLLQNKDESLYYRTDHHWTTYGAFYAYNAFLRSINKPVKMASEYEVTLVSDEFYGTSYSKSNYYNIPPDQLYLFIDDGNYLVNYIKTNKTTNTLYNMDYLNKKDKYSIFLDNNHALIEIDNLDNRSSEKLLLIKNSYGNSFAPFIASDYDQISVIDLRYYKDAVSSYILENNIDRVLILYDINGIYSDPSIMRLK